MKTLRAYKANLNRAEVDVLRGKLKAKVSELKKCRFYHLKKKKLLAAEIKEIKVELTKELNRG